MGKSNDGIYSIVDEEFIKKFKLVHVDYMKNFYYGKYTEYCKKIQSLAVDRETFFTNMRRRRIKIVQTCCPYCGSMQVIITREKMDEIKNHKYCNHCGKSSVSYNIFCQLASFIRIREIHKMGLDIAIEKYKEYDIRILAYEMFHSELVQLTSILEVLLRDFFEAFIYMEYLRVRDDYIAKIIDKSIKNDFMNIDKANNHYKKALNINLRSYIDIEIWESLIDLVNIRNVIVHNNGMTDTKFINSKTYNNIQKYIEGNLIFADAEMVFNFFTKVSGVADIIGTLFEEKYSIKKYELIANYYFNNEQMALIQEMEA